MGKPIPVWVIQFGPDDQIISTAEGPSDEFQPPFVYVEWNAEITVATVSAFTSARAEQVAVAALREHTQERRDRLDATRHTVRAA